MPTTESSKPAEENVTFDTFLQRTNSTKIVAVPSNNTASSTPSPTHSKLKQRIASFDNGELLLWSKQLTKQITSNTVKLKTISVGNNFPTSSHHQQTGSATHVKENIIKVELDWPSFHASVFDKYEHIGDWGTLEEILQDISKKVPEILEKFGSIAIGETLPHVKANKKLQAVHHKFFMEQVTKYTMICCVDHSKASLGFEQDAETGAIVIKEYVEIIKKKQGLQWIHTSFMKDFDQCTPYNKYIVDNYLVPEYTECIRGVLTSEDFCMEIDWSGLSPSQQPELYTKAVTNISSSFGKSLLQKISVAFDEISSTEHDEVVDTIAKGLKKLTIQHSAKKGFEYHEHNQTMIIALNFSEDTQNYYSQTDLIAMIMYAGLFASRDHPTELLRAAASLPNTVEGNLAPMREVIDRNLIWTANEEETEAFSKCLELIQSLQKPKMVVSLPVPGASYEEEQKLINQIDREVTIAAWHVIKFNKNNMAQERIFYLTNKAYYFFNYDFVGRKLDDKKFKRHLVSNVVNLDLGEDVCKVYSSKPQSSLTRKMSTMLGHRGSIFASLEKQNITKPAKPTSKGSFIIMNSSSSPLNTVRRMTTSEVLKQKMDLSDDATYKYIVNHSRNRIKKNKTDRERPNLDGLYANVFTTFDTSKTAKVLAEITWTIYGVVVASQNQRIAEPFLGQVIDRPKGGVSSFVYNVFGWGLSTSREKYVPSSQWIEYSNPLYRTATEYDEDFDFMGETDLALHLQKKGGKVDINRVKMSNFSVQKSIGAGAEGMVYLAIDKQNKRKVAIKSMAYSEKHQVQKVDRELDIILQLNHCNVLKHIDTFSVASEDISGLLERYMYIVMEICQISLEKLLLECYQASLITTSNQGGIPDEIKLDWVKQILEGLAYLHEQSIIHRDIKSENILFRTTDFTEKPLEDRTKWQAKLCDFGFSTKLEQKPGSFVKNNSVVGTPLFMAPEVAMMKNYDFKADVYSLGVVVLQMLMMKPATKMPNVFQLLTRDSEYIKNVCEENNFNGVLSSIAYDCCKADPAQRPTIPELLKKYF